MEPHLAAETSNLGTPAVTDYAQRRSVSPLPLSQSTQHGMQGRFNEEFDASRPQSAMLEGDSGLGSVRRSNSVMSQSQTLTPSRGGTLKKKNSLKRASNLKRSSSRRSLTAGSVRSLNLGDKEKYEGSDLYSAFFTPVPTRGNPTEILANRFQDWRKVLKDLISYFREVQKTHDARSKQLLSLSNIVSNISGPQGFLREGGIAEATGILTQYHKQALAESNKAKGIEEDIMVQLTGLRSDLSQKIKEIKNLSGDFKNSVDKETENTRKSVRGLQEALGLVDTDPSATSGKGDPYIVKLGIERQIDRQIDEENYLHKAFLNLEHSGRELESIVVGEIQKAYNAYASILKREADGAYDAVDKLRNGPILMAKDREWDAFVLDNESFVDPRMPVRSADQIVYPGKDAPAAAEIRAGMLERKSKYLKSYTPGWYVLSPTHLHEFKSADRLNLQTPVMSLYLQEQKIGSHSSPESSSHKFMLKGRQTGGMHRGHGWVFRAETRETMLAWYNDVKSLTEKTGPERDAFVRRHNRSVSGASVRTARSASSDGGMEEDEADQVPYSASASQVEHPIPQQQTPERPQPGRFPSDLHPDRNLHISLSPSSGNSSNDRDTIAAASTLPGSVVPTSQQVPFTEGIGPTRQTNAPTQFTETEVTAPQPNHELQYQKSAHSPSTQQERAAAIDQAAVAVAAVAATAGRASQAMSDKAHYVNAEPVSTEPHVQIALPEKRPLPANINTAAAAARSPAVARSTTYPHQSDGPAELGAGSSQMLSPQTALPKTAFRIGPSAPTTPGSASDEHVLSGAATPTTIMSQMTDSPPVSPPPLTKPASHLSVQTISDLHIPGQYPRQAK